MAAIESLLQCPHCGDLFTQTDILEEHVRSHESRQKKPDTDIQSETVKAETNTVTDDTNNTLCVDDSHSGESGPDVSETASDLTDAHSTVVYDAPSEAVAMDTGSQMANAGIGLICEASSNLPNSPNVVPVKLEHAVTGEIGLATGGSGSGNSAGNWNQAPVSRDVHMDNQETGTMYLGNSGPVNTEHTGTDITVVDGVTSSVTLSSTHQSDGNQTLFVLSRMLDDHEESYSQSQLISPQPGPSSTNQLTRTVNLNDSESDSEEHIPEDVLDLPNNRKLKADSCHFYKPSIGSSWQEPTEYFPSEFQDSDLSEDEYDCNLGLWHDHLTKTSVENFSGPTPGPTFRVAESQNLDKVCADYFLQFITEDMLAEMVKMTKKYSVHCIRKKQRLDPMYTDKDWDLCDPDAKINVTEMKAYIAVNILMGVSPRIEDLDYWSLEPALQNPRVARSMTHSRYQKISQYFHLADPRHDPCNMPLTYEERFLRVQEKPLYKLGNFYMQFLGNCIKNYNLHRDICVSEDQLYSPNCVVPNRSPCVKPYVLMDVLTDYVQNIDFTAPLKDGDSKVKDVVNSLVRNVAFRGHHLYVNGFYTSVDLATVLLEQKTYLTGVLHPGYKDAPFEIMDVPQNRASHHVRTLKKGQFLARRYRLASISAVTYRDTSLSTMISTCHEPFVHAADSDWLLRYININNSAHLVKIPAPRMVVEYTQTRSHVNKALQSHTQYATFQSRQHNKWWKNLFQFCLNVALSNAYVCYKEQNKVDTARFDFKTFVLRVVDGLLNNLPRVKPDTPTKPSPTVVDVTSSHKLSLHNGRGKPCFQCKADGRTQPSGYARDTRYFCSVCAVHLCKGMCFTKWHNRLSAGDTMTRNLGRRSFKGAGYRKRFGTGKTFGAMRSEVVRRTGATSSTRSDFRGNVAHSKQYSQMTNSIVSNQASVTADQAMSSTSAMKPTSMTRGSRQGLSDYPQVAANFMRSEQIASSLRTQQGRTESHIVNTDIAQSQHAVTTSSSGQFASNSSLLRSGQSEDTASTCNVTDYLQVVTGYVRSDQSVAGMVSHDHSAPALTSQHGATELLPVSTHSQKPNQATVSSSHKMTPSRRGKPSSSLSRAVVPFSKAAAVPRPEQVAAAMTSQQLATVMRSYQDIATASGHKIQKVHARGKRCVQCWIDGRRQPSGHPRDTRFFCAVCLVHLCRGLCFAKWHASLSVSKDTDGGGEKGPGKKSKDSNGDDMEKGQTRKSTSQATPGADKRFKQEPPQ